jgi:hypothetical protein
MSKPLKLSGLQIKILREGIVGAYPNQDDLKMLLSEQMDVQLDAIAKGDDYNNKVFNLIQDFETDGQIKKFIWVVVNGKPESPYLESIKNEFAGILGELGGQDKGKFRSNRNSSQPRDITPPPFRLATYPPFGKWFAGVIGTIISGVFVYILIKNPHLPGSLPIPQPYANPEIALVPYPKLRDLLVQGKWKEADQETDDLLLRVSNRKQEGWLREEDVKNLSCEDLRTMDKLWVAYSQGKFGFSVQREIYQSLGGTSEFNSDVMKKFGDRVGWRVNGDWIYYLDVTFDQKAQSGHLPAYVFVGSVGGKGGRVGWGYVNSFLGVSLVNCNI